jgi:hypothetical protein
MFGKRTVAFLWQADSCLYSADSHFYISVGCQEGDLGGKRILCFLRSEDNMIHNGRDARD